MGEDELATVIISEADPEADIKTGYKEFKVPYKGYTVLDVLLYIYQKQDSGIAFRSACGNGFCRCCVVQVNDKPVLACMEPASKYMRIEPHPKFKVLKDLIVDFGTVK